MNIDSSNNMFKQFKSNKYIDATKEFLESNSFIAKLAFLLLVIVVFVILLKFGITILGWLITPTKNPHLIDGMVDGKQLLVFPQDPSSSGSKTILRSNNTRDGIEFSWSTWLFIDDLTYLSNQYKHVFSKGNDSVGANGMITPNNAPGLYINPNTNAITVVMNTFNEINEEIVIPDIPLNKWFNVIIVCDNNILNVYVNGLIAHSRKLNSVPKQNYGDVFVGMNGGFSGYLSNLWYYSYALGTREIQNIASWGPNTKVSSVSMNSVKSTDYISLRWYLANPKPYQYNP